MSLTLEQALQTSAALDDKIAETRSGTERESLQQKKSMVDFYAFGLFKQAGIEQALPSLYKGLGLGVGVGLPALGVGHMLLRDANHQAKDVVHDTRNQVALTALGLGGMHALSNAVGSYMQPKFSADESLHKLAALLHLDNTLEKVVNESTGEVKKAATEQLFIAREQGTALLHRLLLR